MKLKYFPKSATLIVAVKYHDSDEAITAVQQLLHAEGYPQATLTVVNTVARYAHPRPTVYTAGKNRLKVAPTWKKQRQKTPHHGFKLPQCSVFVSLREQRSVIVCKGTTADIDASLPDVKTVLAHCTAPVPSRFDLHVTATMKRVREVCCLPDSADVQLKRMGAGFGRDRYVITVPHDTLITEDAIAEVIIYSSTFKTRPHIRCIGIHKRNPPGANWWEKLEADLKRHKQQRSAATHSQ
jgi:hypothetical protein